MKKQKQKQKNNNEALMFLKTFLVAFLIIVGITTPVMAAVSKVADINPGGEEAPILEEEMDFLIPEDSPFFRAFTESKRVNVLLLGVNSGLTDTIMLVSFDTLNKRVDIISIPRDTYYYRPGYTGAAEMKINAAYRKNPVNSAKAVSEILMGIPINYYAVVDYEGIEKIVDSMGGVPMDIPFRMVYKDPYDKPPLNIDIPAGYQILDGKHAVQFLRYRAGYPEGDLGRVKAQQQFMKNAFKQCLSFDLIKIANTVFENVTSDITIKKALYLAGKGAGMSGDNITTYTMPGWADPKPPYYVQPDAEKISEMLTQIYSPPEEEEETSGGAIASDGAIRTAD